jgi:opacity protein-like surface antigen
MKSQGLLLRGAISLILAAISLNAQATTGKHPVKDYKGMGLAIAEGSAFSGWSAGVGVGVNNYNMNSNISTNTNTFESPFISGVPGDIVDLNGRSTVNKFGAMGNLFIGYGYVNDIYYVGAHMGINLVGATMLNTNQTNAFNINVTDSNDLSSAYYYYTLTTQTKVSRSWVEPFLDIKLGGLITPETLAYAIAGVSVDSVTLQSITAFNTSVSVPGISSSTANSVLNYSKTRNMVGFRLGAGAETMITSKFGVGAQYVYSFFSTFNNNSSLDSVAAVADTELGCITTPVTITNHTQTQLNDQQVSVQFIYHI